MMYPDYSEESLFPLVKRFKDVIETPNTIVLKEEMIIHEKCFRVGTVFQVLGWREINQKVYLVISKGSWEGLVDYDRISHLVPES